MTALWLDIDDPETWKTVKDRYAVRLFHLQRGVCALCGKPLPRRANKNNSNRISLDHVWPRNRAKIEKGKPTVPGCGRWVSKSARRKGRRRPWNFVVAHGRCNSAKGDRAPTGCELIWLMQIRARIEGPALVLHRQGPQIAQERLAAGL